MLKVIQLNVTAFIHASPELKKDKEVIFFAVQDFHHAILYLPEELKKNKEFLIECYRINNKIIEINDFMDNSLFSFEIMY